MKIGILSPATIAINRFLPALKKNKKVEFAGVAVANMKERGAMSDNSNINSSFCRANKIVMEYGGRMYNSYFDLLNDNEIDAVYLPLPPILHYKWGKEVLIHNKHLFMEKPFTITFDNTKELCDLAKKNCKIVYENYMFVHHIQLKQIIDVLNSGIIGTIRNINICFGFPLRNNGDDFRYKKEFGGGSLFDCAGYTFKLANILIKDAVLEDCKLFYDSRFDVDLYGSAVLYGKSVSANVSFAMDSEYRCSLEVWGSDGILFTNRIFTAPANYKPSYSITKNGETKCYNLSSDDSFYNSITYFYDSVNKKNENEIIINEILQQSYLIQEAWAISERYYE